MTSSFPYKLIWMPNGFYQVLKKDDVDVLPGCLYEPLSKRIVKRSNPTIVIGKYNEQTGRFEMIPTINFNPESGHFEASDIDLYKPSLEYNEQTGRFQMNPTINLESSTPVSNMSNVSPEQSTPTPASNIDDELALRTEPLPTQLEMLAAKLREAESKMDFEERKLLSPKVLDTDSKELAQLQYSSATTLDLLESIEVVLSKLKPELEEKNKFVNSIKEYCHLDRHELIKLLFEKDKQLSIQKDLERRSAEYDDLLYRFKFVCSLFCSTLADPSGLDGNDYSSRFDFLENDVLDWKSVDYQLWKLSEWDDGIVRSKHTPLKPEWDLKPWKHNG